MIKATPLSPLLMVATMLLLNACTTTLPDVTERRDPVERPPRVVKTPVTKPILKPTRRPSAVTTPYRPAPTSPVSSTRPNSRPRPTVGVRPDLAESGANPYDKIPQSGRDGTTRNQPRGSSRGTSSAVKALLLRAKVDIVAARYGAAASRLERALRIEPRNAEVWHQLARINYKQGKHASSVTMAQKSNSYTLEDSPLEKANWSLIKQASKAAGDIRTLKRAIQYERSHP